MRRLVLLALFLLYLIRLTALPVFSDEAIYIRWAQLAFSDPGQYLFLPLLDGKSPLHVWSMVPFLQVFSDPLFAGRLVSVLAGLVSAFVAGKIVQALGGKKASQVLTMLFIAISPFFFFHNRLAVADGLLTAFFLTGVYALLQSYRDPRWGHWMMLGSVCIGATLWIKPSALFFFPVYTMVPLLWTVHSPKWGIRKTYVTSAFTPILLAMFGGLALFFILRISPLFPSLFSRSSDYSFSLSQILEGEWRHVLFGNIPSIVRWLGVYMTPFLLALAVFERKKNVVILLMILVYVAPYVLFGKVLYSRYMLPAGALIAIAAGIGWETLHKKKSLYQVQNFLVKGYFSIAVGLLIVLLIRPERSLLLPEDRVQYLTEWSSGYGIPQIRDYFIQRMKEVDSIAVGTEGYFGTLPDGLQIYFEDPKYAGRLYLFGVGQPIRDLHPALLEQTKLRETYLVVNKHRFFVDNPERLTLIHEYPRPLDGPPLLLLRVHPSTQ